MPKKSMRPQPKDNYVCWCNMVSNSRIEEAIEFGAQTLDEIFDKTTAGVGACGGSCRPYIKAMLDSYQKNGTFPENPRPPKGKRR